MGSAPEPEVVQANAWTIIHSATSATIPRLLRSSGRAARGREGPQQCMRMLPHTREQLGGETRRSADRRKKRLCRFNKEGLVS